MIVTDYDILQSSSAEELTAKVRQAILEGWQPLGAVAVAVSQEHDRRDDRYYSDTLYSQTMIKKVY